MEHCTTKTQTNKKLMTDKWRFLNFTGIKNTFNNIIQSEKQVNDTLALWATTRKNVFVRNPKVLVHKILLKEERNKEHTYCFFTSRSWYSSTSVAVVEACRRPLAVVALVLLHFQSGRCDYIIGQILIDSICSQISFIPVLEDNKKRSCPLLDNLSQRFTCPNEISTCPRQSDTGFGLSWIYNWSTRRVIMNFWLYLFSLTCE